MKPFDFFRRLFGPPHQPAPELSRGAEPVFEFQEPEPDQTTFECVVIWRWPRSSQVDDEAVAGILKAQFEAMAETGSSDLVMLKIYNAGYKTSSSLGKTVSRDHARLGGHPL